MRVNYGEKIVNGKKEVDYDKWIDLSELPRWKDGMNKDNIDWTNSEGYIIDFKYKDIIGKIFVVKYNKDDQKLTISYKHLLYDIKTDSLQKIKLGKLLRNITNDFQIEINIRLKDKKRDMIIIKRSYVKDKSGRKWRCYKYKCNKCGFDCGEHYKNGKLIKEHWIREDYLLRSVGCTCCSGISVVPHINSIVATESTHWMIPYFQGGYDEAKMYTPSSSKKLYFKCPNSNEINKEKMNICSLYYSKSTLGVWVDGISYPNKVLRYFLYKLKEIYDTVIKFEYNIKDRKYDGYIKYKNIEYLIEMDGIQHKNNSFNRDEVKNDKYKNNLARDNGFNLIRIDCEFSNISFIKNNILKSELAKIFNLLDIDWIEIDKLCQKNIVKEVCKYWDNKKEYETTSDLVNIFNLSRFTILEYLKKGNEFGWCNYNAKEELMKNAIKDDRIKGAKRKQIEIFKDNASLGVFNGVTELEVQSETLFGIKLNGGNISKVANGERKHHKGFTFKYI